MNKKLKDLSKKLGLNENQIMKIICYNHLLDNLFKKNEYKKIALNIELKSMKYIKKVAKTLKVADDAVINAALQNWLELKENEL